VSLTDRLFLHPKRLLLVLALLSAAVAHRALWLEQDNSPDAFFGADQEARQSYQSFKETFGRDEVVLLRWEGAELDSPDHIQRLHALAQRAQAIPGVVDALYPGRDLPVATSADTAKIAAESRAFPLFGELALVREQPPSLSLLLQVVMEGPASRPLLAEELAALRRDFAEAPGSPGPIRIASLATANAAIDAASRRTLSLFMPLLVLLAAVVGLALFRSLTALLPLLAPALAAVGVAMGALQWTGHHLNLITGVMPPLVLSVSIAASLHLLTHYATGCRCASPLDSIRCTLRDKATPTLLALVTTAVGFGSLATSEVEAIQVLGWSTALGLGAASVLVILGTPALLAVLQPRMHMPPARQERPRAWAQWAASRRVGVMIGAALIVALIGAGTSRLNVVFDGMQLLPEDHEARQTFVALEAEGLGLGNIEVWIDAPMSAEALRAARPRLEAMAKALAHAPHVHSVLGVHRLLEIAEHRAGPLAPGLWAILSQENSAGTNAPDLSTSPTWQSFRDAIRGYWSPTRGLRLTLLSSTGEANTFQDQTRLIHAAAAEHFPDAQVQVTGQFAMLLSTPPKLMSTMLRSLALTVLLIAVALGLAFRSLRLVAAALVSNLVPVVLLLGAMGWLGVPIDIATVMAASVVLGIVVDDTVHWLHAYRPTRDVGAAAHAVSHGMVATTLVLSVSFLVLALSGFDPVVRFALGSAAAIAVALGVELVLLPALVATGTKQPSS